MKSISCTTDSQAPIRMTVIHTYVAAADLHLSQVSIWSAVLPMTSSRALSTFQVREGAQGKLRSSAVALAATDLTTS